MSKHQKLLPLSPVPLYSQLKELLRTKILDGSYPAHSQMPSESELGSIYKVSRITVRQALSDLHKEGLIFKIHGKGTFVAKLKRSRTSANCKVWRRQCRNWVTR